MLDETLYAQLKSYLERVREPIEIVATLDDSQGSRDMRALLTQIESACALITLRTDGHDRRVPSFSLNRVGGQMGLRFAAVPLGHEFTSLVLALLQVGGHPPKVEPELAAQIRALPGGSEFEAYVSLTCHNCPDVVQALNTMAVLNPGIRVTTLDGGLFPDEIAQRQIMAVPTVFLNGEMFGSGRMGLAEIVAKLDAGGAARAAQALAERAPYDMLVIGGGPAGAAAAVYAARKGIRTGVVAERFGGQTLDTLAIENYISVLETQGPTFAAALESHVRAYGVDVMNLQRVEALHPADADGFIGVQLVHGARLRSRSVVLATGARWREMNVPGEREYRNRGVAYCPHCDGPLFKGRRVAVVGGGNSGVEAAIDLAGLVEHVTLVEFMPELKADAVLVEKLKSLSNVDIRTQTQTTSVQGDGNKVTGLELLDRASGEATLLPLAGVFVQIGLVPNTDWLRGSVELSRAGEIIVDAKGQTSLPGVFAAGDATTVPFKQIVIAAGDGAKAALGAFEHLMRQSVVA